MNEDSETSIQKEDQCRTSQQKQYCSDTRSLPPETEMDRSDALDAFVEVVNVVQPDHPSRSSPYPIDREDVDFGVTRTKLASCGPRSRKSQYTVGYSTRMTAINEITRERHLALLVHESTHIPVGRHSTEQHGSHPPRFWKGMAFNAVLVHDSLQEGRLADVFPDADPEDFVREVVESPNAQTVDQRYWTVNECKDEVHDILTYCILYEHSYEYLPESTY
jgi:hypothetical protein